ncbi:uncharacterized protein LOC135931537 isoform X2 [Gordionus sp. m RMFG-2023]|uniref:uncharacterized protein LOC135931537 isoform X2 n=1 Tax=Gordionus sp. m RMFG-2023 TaxID=3053472 RepID=UPI0031FBA6AC
MRHTLYQVIQAIADTSITTRFFYIDAPGRSEDNKKCLTLCYHRNSILLTCVDCPGFNCHDFNLPSPDPITQSNLYDPIIEADIAMVMLANLNVLQRHAFDQQKKGEE